MIFVDHLHSFTVHRTPPYLATNHEEHDTTSSLAVNSHRAPSGCSSYCTSAPMTFWPFVLPVWFTNEVNWGKTSGPCRSYSQFGLLTK